MTRPVYEYAHDEGCSVTGGFVYRGCRMPDHHGKYFLAEWCDGWVRSIEGKGAERVVNDWPGLAVLDPASFGQDARGELYVVSLRGSVYRIAPAE